MHITQFIFKEQAIVFFPVEIVANAANDTPGHIAPHCSESLDALELILKMLMDLITFIVRHAYLYDCRIRTHLYFFDVLMLGLVSVAVSETFFAVGSSPAGVFTHTHSLTHSRRRPKLLNSLLHGRLQKPAGSC